MKSCSRFVLFLLGLYTVSGCPTCDSYTGPIADVCGTDGVTYSSECELLVELCNDGTISLGDGTDINTIPISVIVAQHKNHDGKCIDDGDGGNCPDCANVNKTNAIPVCDASLAEYNSSCSMAKKMCDDGVLSFDDGFNFTSMTEQLYREKINVFVNWNGKCQGPCPVGQFSDSGNLGPCRQCGPGSYAASPGSKSCELCAQDSYQDEAGSAGCKTCPNGTDTVNKGSTNISQCIEDCLAGHYSVTGKAPCTKCPTGTWTNATASTSCNACPAGSYSTGSACVECQYGQYTDTANSTTCTSCPAGTSTNSSSSHTTGATSCVDCQPGTYQNQTGSPVCRMCEKGTYNNATAATTCDQCAAGHFQIELGKTFCYACTEGTYQNSTGSMECLDCPRSYYQDNEAQSWCKKCPQRQTTDGEGSISSAECHFTECKAGTVVVIRNGKITCDSCDAGYYQNKNNQTSCLKCPYDTYQNVEGSVTCVRCPENHVTYTDGATQFEECEGPAIQLCVGTGLSGYCTTIYDKKDQLASNLRGRIRSFKVIRGDWYIFSSTRYGGRKIRLNQGVVRTDVNNGNQFPRVSYLSSGAFHSIRPVVTEVMCYAENGLTYTGYRSETQRGVTCQNWKANYPHSNINGFSGTGVGNHNYCRNPDNDGNGPWCYTTDPARRWDYCGVPKCKWNVDCYTERGAYYRGTRSKTAGNDYNCNDWYSNWPHPHSWDNDFNAKHYGVGHHRYCRNPNIDSDNRPWCYTTYFFKRWAYCDVPKCEFSSTSYFNRKHAPKATLDQ